MLFGNLPVGSQLRLPRMSGGDPREGLPIRPMPQSSAAGGARAQAAAAVMNLNEIMSEEDDRADFRINLNSAEPRGGDQH